MTILVNQRDNGRGEAASGLARETVQSQPPAHAIRVRLEKLATGCWSVQAAAGACGGLFRDYASATKFIRREFAARQHTVVELLSA